MTKDDRVLHALLREARNAERRDPRLFPHFSEHGQWQLLAADRTSRWRGEDYDHGNWTFGFWYGLMWLTSTLTRDDTAARLARDRLAMLMPRAQDRTTHDLGFIFWPSLVLGHRLGFLSSSETEPALVAAQTLADRFVARGDYIQAFGEIGHPRGAATSTIDTMMNLPLLWWAGASTGESRFHEVAHRHATRTRATFIREDGSTFHLNHFDPATGALVRQGTFQGAGERSCWSRGQAWAICGFAFAYAATADSEMLHAFEQTADYFWAHLPDDKVPPWDFIESEPAAPRDASAGAIAGLGALILSDVHPQEDRRRSYRAHAESLLDGLRNHVDRAEPIDGVLQCSSYSVPHGLGMDGATAWGDFFFTLANAVLTDRVPAPAILDRVQVSGPEGSR
jgi:unsaturated chondroitin disaccharide hydrolase